ncbi:MAG: T9SS type A sorting domain-containing protein [Croceivirga sp.]
MKNGFLTLGAFFSLLSAIGQQNCNCDVTLSGLSQNSLNGIWASQVNYQPGDVICIPAGNYAGLRFYNFEGTETAPLTIINCGGQVVIDETNYSGLEFRNSKYIHVTGTGDSKHYYGIKIEGTSSWAMGVAIGDFSTDFEVDHVEVESAGFAGIMAKTDPICSNSATWRTSGFVMKNLDIHHNHIQNTGGEGIYIGFTLGYKLKTFRYCSGTPVFGHWLENVDVHHNIVEQTGWDAIQLNLVNLNGKIRDNQILDYATEGRWAQAFAISLGGGTYEVYNNLIVNGPTETGAGIQLISGESGSKIYNNVLVKPKEHGIFLHNRHVFDDVNEGYYIVNNTIIEPQKAGVHLNADIYYAVDPNDVNRKQDEVPSHFVNNLIVDPGYDFSNSNFWKKDQESYFDFNAPSTRDSLLPNIYSNIMTRQIDTLGLNDTANDEYWPGSQTSSVVDVGHDVSAWGIVIDLENNSRPSGTAFDIGAYEYQVSGTSLRAAIPTNLESTTPLEAKTYLYPNPSKTKFTLYNPQIDGSVSLQITSSENKVIYEGSYIMGSPFYIDDVSSGLYFLKILNGDQTETYKLMVID